MALPQVIMTGTLVADPELRFTKNQDAVVNFRVACNSRKFNKATQEWEDGDTTFLSCSLWGTAGRNFADTARKGMRVSVQGRLRQESYTTNDGENRTVYNVAVDEAAMSLKYATANVQPVGRATGHDDRDAVQGKDSSAWAGGGERGGFSGQGDEPPF